MSGLRITIPTTFTDTTLPILRDDPMLTTGSLALIEPAHPTNPLVGVPADAGSIPNIAHAEAAALMGVTDTGLPAEFKTSGTLTGAKGLLERTSKGGLHGIVSKAPGVASGDGAQVRLGASSRAWLYSNKGHQFYFSFWGRTTRVSTSTAGQSYEVGSGDNSSQFLFIRDATGPAQVGAPPPYLRTISLQSLASYLVNASPTPNNTNLAAAPNNAGPVWGARTGTFNNAISGWYTQLPSFVFYRMYVEDLTVSGRSYATVDALDLAQYTKEVATAGGRYYGDSYTDPATIA